MAIIGITLRNGRIETAFDGAPGEGALAQAAAEAPAASPIVFLIHGFLFDPHPPTGGYRDRRRHPHRLILSAAPNAQRAPRRLSSWPIAMGFRAGTTDDGLAVGVGWPSLPIGRDGLAFGAGLFRRAYDEAALAAATLSRAIRIAALARPGAPVEILAHSLGARVALLALRQAAAGGFAHRIGRVLLLNPAEYRAEAALAARAVAGSGPQVVNVISRENDLFDALLQVFGPCAAQPLGAAGLSGEFSDWLDLQLDHPRTLHWLAGRGVAPRRRRICHWSSYTRPGLFAFYSKLLRDRETIARLEAAGAPRDLEHRWARVTPAAPKLSRLAPIRPQLADS